MSANNWQVLHIRLTAFPAAVAQPNPQHWLETLTKHQPDTHTTKQGDFQQMDTVCFKGGELTCESSSLRIDFYHKKPDAVYHNLETTGSFVDINPLFSSLMTEWLQALPIGLTRLAFGVDLIQTVDTIAVASAIVSTYLPFTIEDGIHDFVYQVNKRQLSKVVNGLSYNRIVKWGIHEMSTGGCMARCLLDINTSYDYPNNLPGAQLCALWTELVQAGTQLVSNERTNESLTGNS